MRTIQILSNIIDTLSQSPNLLPQIPWIDLETCLTNELEERHFLYSKPSYTHLQHELNTIFSQINSAVLQFETDIVIYHLTQLSIVLTFLPEVDYSLAQYQQAHYNQACLNHYRNNTIIVLGDSHVNFFSGNELLSFIPIGHDINTCDATHLSHYFTPLHLGPCLAYHCNELQTLTHFSEKWDYLCNHFIKPNATIICSLGEIDLRVHVFRQTILQNKSYEEIVDDILQQYYTFLLQMKNQGYSLYCWGPIATQTDACPIDPNFPRNGSEEDRNHATAYFNQQLSAFCKQHDIGYLSIFEQMITPNFKTRSEYLSADYCHLSQRALPLAWQEWKKLNHPTLPDNLL